MKKQGRLVLVLISSIWFFLSPNILATAVKNTAGEDKIIAVVNDDVVTQSELNSQLDALKQQFQHSGTPLPSEKEMHDKVLDGLINKTIQMQLAKKNNIVVDDNDLNKTIDDIAKRNKVTLAQMQTEIEREGLTYAAFRSNIKEQMLLNKVQQQALGKTITVTDEEVDAFMQTPQAVQKIEPTAINPANKYHVIDVLIPIADNSAEKMQVAKDKALQIFTKLQNNKANFENELKLLKDSDKTIHSEDLGMRPLGAFPNIFVRPISTMHVGDVIGPLEAPNGYHILYLIAGGTNAPTHLHHLTKDEARQFLYQQKFNEKLVSWLRELRATAYVKIND